MRVLVKPNTINQLKEVAESKCAGIRFGSEFCENSIPDIKTLRHAHELAEGSEKSFSYNIPLLTNRGLDKIKPQLEYLNEIDDIEIVTGDLGVLNLLRDKEVKTRLGRTRVYIPARSPWDQITRMPNPSFFALRKVEKLFYQTSLNYRRVLEFFTSHGVVGADVDLIPKCFSNYRDIIKKGLSLSTHTHCIPIAVTMRCHTARFLGESSPEECSLPCMTKVHTIKQRELGKKFLLHGNVVYRSVDITSSDIKTLNRIGVEELIIPMSPLNEINTAKEIDDYIRDFNLGA